MGGEDRQQIKGLKDETYMASTPGGQLSRGDTADLSFSDGHRARIGDVESADQVQNRRLARSTGAHESRVVTIRDVQIELVEDDQVFTTSGILFGNRFQLNVGVLAHRFPPIFTGSPS